MAGTTISLRRGSTSSRSPPTGRSPSLSHRRRHLQRRLRRRVSSTSVVPPSSTTAAAAVIGSPLGHAQGTASAGTSAGRRRVSSGARGPPPTPTSSRRARSRPTTRRTRLQARLTGLAPNTVYHARLVTSGPGGAASAPTDLPHPEAPARPAARQVAARRGRQHQGCRARHLSADDDRLHGQGRAAARRQTAHEVRIEDVLDRRRHHRVRGRAALDVDSAARQAPRVVKITAALLATDGDDVAFPDARRSAKLFWRG